MLVMPSLADLEVSVSPRDEPLCYPGSSPGHSFLWFDSWVYQVTSTPRSGLDDWRLALDGGPLGSTSPRVRAPADRRGERLAAVLRAAGVAGLTERYPVLAYGSNAAPAQLLDKFGWLEPRQRVVPVTIGQLEGFALAHSAHVSNPGYLPYVLVDGGAGAALEVRVLWLDGRQLAALNETEPNYTLMPVNAAAYPLTLESGEAVPRYSAYRGSRGALRWPGEAGPAPAATQQDTHGRLARSVWFAGLVGRVDVPAQVQLLRQDKSLRDRVRDELAARGMAVADGWIES
ncbi:MAG: hypothetical protein ABJD68_11120 [Nakamurella sp.]